MTERCSGRYNAQHESKSRYKVLVCGLTQGHEGPCGPWIVDDTYQNVELWERELTAAGWRPNNHHSRTIWRSPSGSLHLGPFGAWKTMKAAVSAREQGT